MIKAFCIGLLCLMAQAPKAPAPTVAPVEFKYACAYADYFYGVECGDLQPPTVVTSRIVKDLYYGLYIPGEQFIFVNKRLWLHDKIQWHETVVHETMHYILRAKADERFDRCQSEEAARYVGASWLGVAYDDSWRLQYKCNV